MEQLMEHTLQRQMTEMKDQMTTQTLQIAELTALLRGQLVVKAPEPSVQTALVAGSITVNTGQVTQNTLTQINIRPWDGDDKISVPVALIAAAFSENPRLIEYCSLDDTSKADPEIASPYILEALMDLTRRAHADPLSRNIYLSPNRADQVMICLKSGRWEVYQLESATCQLFDEVTASIQRVIMKDSERKKLPPDVQGAASFVPMHYKANPEEYIKRARKPLAAHLANLAPVQGKR